MIEVSQKRARTMLAIHGWSGILLGALLYLVIVVGGAFCLRTALRSREIATLATVGERLAALRALAWNRR